MSSSIVPRCSNIKVSSFLFSSKISTSILIYGGIRWCHSEAEGATCKGGRGQSGAELTQGPEGTRSVPGFASLYSGSRKQARVPVLGLNQTEISLLYFMLLITILLLAK